MGLFSKARLAGESNEINNRELKETLANTALQMLQAGVHYKTLDHTVCEFGYLFLIENHGLEALMKLTTDVDTYYFAAQGSSMLQLSCNETMFQGVSETFLQMHT